MPMHTSWGEYKTGMGWPTLLSRCPAGRDKTYESEISNDFSHNDFYPYEARPGNDLFDLKRANKFSQNRQVLSLL